MAEYIDKEKLLQKLSRMIDYCENDNKVNGLTSLFQVIDAIMDCPTADVVEVVRCKDCKYFSEFHHCGILGFCEPNEYCSRGERRKEDG